MPDFQKEKICLFLPLEDPPHFLSDPVSFTPESQVPRLAFSFFAPCLLRPSVPQCRLIPYYKPYPLQS